MPTDRLDPSTASPVVPNPQATRFFDSACETFDHAAQSAGEMIDRFYDLGGHVVRLRFAGPALVDTFTRALRHRAATKISSPVLTICLWDCISTDTGMLSLPWGPDDYLPRGVVSGYNDERFYATVNTGLKMLQLGDIDRRTALFVIEDPALLSFDQYSLPLRALLHWGLRPLGSQPLHAGAVGLGSEGVLVVGRGGGGKSTTCISCLDSELLFLSDDYCLLGPSPEPRVSNLYGTAKVNHEDVGRFPNLKPDTEADEKVIYYLNEQRPEKLASHLTIRAVLVPRVTGGEKTTTSSASSMIAFRALAPSTMFQLPGAGETSSQHMAELIRSVPCYTLRLGTDLPGIPQAILSLLNKVRT